MGWQGISQPRMLEKKDGANPALGKAGDGLVLQSSFCWGEGSLPPGSVSQPVGL